MISRATSLCISQVAAARSACLSRAVAGGTCDEDSLADTVSNAQQRALDRLERACTGTQLQNLGYIDLFDAQRDVTNACRQLDTATRSAAFGPVMVGGSIAAVDPITSACVRATAVESTRLLRFAMRAQQQALDRIAASTSLSAPQKQRLVDWAHARVARAQAGSAAQIGAVCSDADFVDTYGRSAAEYLSEIAQQSGCMAGFVYVQDAIVCPPAECGNGVQEQGEECDDGNDFEGDGCRGDCLASECDAFPTTYALIQKAIFENHGCTNDACHGAAKQGGLDLRAGAALASTIDQPSSVDPSRSRIEPGAPQRSVLWLKLAAKTLPDQYPSSETGVGAPMPSIGDALSADELEALRLWIYNAASETASVPGVGDLLDACTPEPKPIEIKPLPPPPAGEGVQLHMPHWQVDAKAEHEVCFASYYDVTDQVPEELRGPGDTFCYNTEQLRQDPLSHHLIVSLYIGSYGPDDPSWGAFKCSAGPKKGEACTPTDVGFCGEGYECSTDPRVQVTCSGFGPPDPTQNSIQFTGAQQPNFYGEFPTGAYRCIPLKGMLLWNSHAFNLTDQAGDLQAWLNFTFAKPEERQYFANGLFELGPIFKMSVPAFQQQEVCAIKTFRNNLSSNLFELNSHMHSRGKRWRTFRGAFTCNGDGVTACDPLDPRQCAAGATCTDPQGRDPNENLIYTNFLYNDPVHLRFNPPMVFQGGKSNRSLTYCALYDNGFTDPDTVKKASQSPLTPFGTSTCPKPTHCTAGKPKEPCSGNSAEERNRSCDSAPGANDGFCDACTLNGGVTTADEMFLLLGSYYEAPEQQ
ncbi:MAG: hypothetical protein SF182_26560 [Deltaproteobacteria bacterium]|nr:hypothetical protein [Deltaproteobacteria bacterium]